MSGIVKPRNLPSGYTQVKYIISSGTQYIKTGFKPNNNTRVVMDFQFVSATASDNAVIFGARDATNVNSFCVFCHKDGYFRSDYGQTNTNQFDIDRTIRYTIDKNKETTSLGNTTQSYSATTFKCNYDIYLFALNTGGSFGFGSQGLIMYSCLIYDNGTLVRDYVPCLNANGTAGLYDMVNGVFYANAGTGNFTYVGLAQKPKGNLYIGVKDTARKINKEYIGVDEVARRVKKAYIGIGGVARPCFSGGELAYFGAIIPLSNARSNLAAASVGDYALFGGGYYSKYFDTVDAYDKSLTRTAPTPLSKARGYLAATAVGDYALFGGGSSDVGIVDAYDKSLTRTTPTPLSVAMWYLDATSVGDYALFGGGGGNVIGTVEAYDESLTRTTLTPLSVARTNLAATAVGDYALFGGGSTNSGNPYGAVDAYDKSLTRTTPTPLSVARCYLAATAIGSHALFGGGNGVTVGITDTVDAYDESLTRTTPTPLSVARRDLAATAVGDYALFGGGYNDINNIKYSTVDAYDESLTRTTPTPLSVARRDLAATAVGDYALFGGGGEYGSYIAAVDIYTVA